MPATEPFCQLLKINTTPFTKEEKYLIELEFFVQLCDELKQVIKSRNINYFRLIKLNTDKEEMMLDENLIRYVINDILLSEEYTLEGIACYTQVPEEVICDIVVGKNQAPSLPTSRKIIELHKSIRPNLYREIMKKIAAEYLTQTS